MLLCPADTGDTELLRASPPKKGNYIFGCSCIVNCAMWPLASDTILKDGQRSLLLFHLILTQLPSISFSCFFDKNDQIFLIHKKQDLNRIPPPQDFLPKRLLQEIIIKYAFKSVFFSQKYGMTYNSLTYLYVTKSSLERSRDTGP